MENKKGKTIKEASIIELKAECFDIDGQIKMLQRKNQEIIDELNLRYSEMRNTKLNEMEGKKDGITKD